MPFGTKGYLKDWETPHFDPDTPYLDGLFIASGLQAYSRKPSSSTKFHMKSHANTSIIQGLYFGPEAADRRDGFNFSIEFQVFYEELMLKIRSIGAQGSWFYFCPFDRVTDIFQATSGESYKLNRPTARSVVSGVTDLTHPDLIYLDGSLDPSAATVSGQSVTANGSGVILIDYTPVYKVTIAPPGFEEGVGEIGEIIVKGELEEVVVI